MQKAVRRLLHSRPEHGIGDQNGCGFDKIQFSDQVQRMSLPVGAGQGSRVDGVLGFDFGADHVGNVKQEKYRQRQDQQSDQRQDQNLSALPVFSVKTRFHHDHSRYAVDCFAIFVSPEMFIFPPV